MLTEVTPTVYNGAAVRSRAMHHLHKHFPDAAFSTIEVFSGLFVCKEIKK